MNSKVLFFTVFLVACLMAPTGASGNMLGIHDIGNIVRASTGVYLEISPSTTESLGQVNVTYTIHNVERLYAWQIALNCTTSKYITAVLPENHIFAGQNTVGLLNGTEPAKNLTVLMNCLLGSSANANGTAPLVQVTFEVEQAPGTFTISTEQTFFLDNDLNNIPYNWTGK